MKNLLIGGIVIGESPLGTSWKLDLQQHTEIIIRMIWASEPSLEEGIRHLYQVQLENGTLVPLKALFARVPFSQSPLVQQLGLSLNEQGYIMVNPFQQTSLAHVFAAGNCTTTIRSVSTAVAQGTMAGAAINKFLLNW